MLENVFLVMVGIALWFAVARDAFAVQQRSGRRVWNLSNRTWAWIVAITFVGLVPYAVGRTVALREASLPPS